MIATGSTSTGVADEPQAGVRRRNELRALSALVFEDLRAFPGGIRDMHLGIAERAFRGVGPAARPVQVIHDTLSRRAYDAVSSGAARVGLAADAAMERQGIRQEVQLSTTRRGSAVIAALNGLVGDRLERSGSDLHQPASVRVDGEAVALDASSLSAAFPEAMSRLVVFLHGLMGTEFYWEWGGAHPGDTYGARLASDLGCTPIYLRYNTGLHVSENGLSIAALLEELVHAWPVEVQEIALVGHSMGGLIARSACHQGSESGRCWTERVGHVVSLGTPHLGAPLERGAHFGCRGAPRAARDADARRLPAPALGRHPRPPSRLARRRGLAGPSPQRPAGGGVQGGATTAGSHALLRLGHDHPQPAPSPRAPARRHPRADT